MCGKLHIFIFCVDIIYTFCLHSEVSLQDGWPRSLIQGEGTQKVKGTTFP